MTIILFIKINICKRGSFLSQSSLKKKNSEKESFRNDGLISNKNSKFRNCELRATGARAPRLNEPQISIKSSKKRKGDNNTWIFQCLITVP